MSTRFLVPFILLLTFMLVSCGPCENCEKMAERETALTEREAAIAEHEAVLELREAALATPEYVSEEAADDSTPPNADKASLNAEHPIRLGTHNITLQWIGWDHPGTAEVSLEADNRYRIVGEQRSKENDDYLTIDGSLVQQDERTFIFDGTVEYRVSHNNGGEPCVKTGPLHFRQSGQRKYWRMQEKTNCEGGMLTDYVDIYF